MKRFFKFLTVTSAILLSTFAIAVTQHKVLLVVTPGCEYCQEAERILDKSGIKYHTSQSRSGGSVPRLYVDDQYQGTGVDAVQEWVNANR